MIRVDRVSKSYGELLAIHDISLTVASGEIAILMGPNGAGKSTLIKSITGLLRFDGSITIGGFPNKSLEAKRLLGYVPDMPAVYDLLTVSEHLEFIARAYRISNWRDMALSLLERFELLDKKDTLGKELSKGMQQKLSICCAILPRPQAIIFDEPMVGLDPQAIKELRLLFRELSDSGAALLISTHLASSVENIWDTVHIMAKGAFVASKQHNEGDAEDLNLEELFFAATRGESGIREDKA